MFTLGFGSDFLRAVFLSPVPLFLVVSHTVVGGNAVHHFNHEMTAMFRTHHHENHSMPIESSSSKCPILKQEKFVLELSAILVHQDIASVAGCAAVNIPLEPGEHDLEVMTWRPIALSSMGTTRSQMHHYYLGTSLDQIGATEAVPTRSHEQDWVKDTKLLSKHDLHSDVSGTIRVRVNIAENNFHRELAHVPDPSDIDGSGYQSQRVFIRETVDEVLNRVRRNKRLRMGEANATNSLHHLEREERGETAAVHANLSSRAMEVLQRARSRQRSNMY